MNAAVLNLKTKKSEAIDLPDSIFSVEYNDSLVHQVVTSYLSGARSGTKAQKNRSLVADGGRKPYAQKGSGRSRSGTSSNPIWRGGGVNFASTTRSYAKKVNRKMYRKAMRIIFSELLRDKRLTIVDDISVDAPKTKFFVQLMRDLDLTDSLFIIDSFDENLYLSARNLHHVGVLDVSSLQPVSLIDYKTVVVTKKALSKFNIYE